MADCTAPTLSVPDLGCFDNPQTWAGSLVTELQSAIDHMVGCIADFEYPQCDICVMADDLIACPLVANMIDFSAVTWAEDGEQGVMPYQPNVGDDTFRYGSGTITPGYRNSWDSVAVVFSTPFPASCHVVLPVVTASGGCPSGIDIDGNDYAIMVKDKTVNGCTVWIYREGDDDCTVTFDYLAYGN